MSLTVDPAAVAAALSSGKPVVYRVRHASEKVRLFFGDLLACVLQQLNRQSLQESLRYVVGELIYNADKANLKRAYFRIRNLDINDPCSYREGLQRFAEDITEDESRYTARFGEFGLYCGVAFQVAANRLAIVVRNSGVPTAQELQRLRDRVELSKRVRDAGEAFLLAQDFSEGAGIGTITLMLMLRSIGVDESAFQLTSDTVHGETVARVDIPLNTVTEEQADELSGQIASEISSIPHYPENILRIQKMIADPDIPFSHVAAAIQHDPALAAELLKTVNSAQYGLTKKVASIQNAATMLGIKGLRSLLASTGAEKVMRTRYAGLPNMDAQWKHAYRCAFYAQSLSRELGLSNANDELFVSGLLHDIGKIVIMAAHPDVNEAVTRFCSRKAIAGNVIERLAMGASHERIGAHIAAKWSFPESIVRAVEFHHRPLLAPDEFRKLAAIIHLSDYIAWPGSDAGEPLSRIDPFAFELLGIGSEERFKTLKEMLLESYQEQCRQNEN